jgi:hypothetical protein
MLHHRRARGESVADIAADLVGEDAS